jgi:elongation factor G
LDVSNKGLNLSHDNKEVIVSADPDAPLVAFAFKLEEGRYGQLTYLRVYRGRLSKGSTIHNIRTGKKLKVGRLVRMHADKMEEIEDCGPGDIVAMFGIDCASGDTFSDGREEIIMASMHVPEPVISLAITPQDNKTQERMNKALNRFCREDPTFRTHYDQESGQTIVSGMGELHLDIYIERMKREYRASIESGMPQVAYRETISRPAEFDYLHKKQTGGAGQYGRVVGAIEPYPDGIYNFVKKVVGGHIPSEYIPSCDKGFQDCLKKGTLIGFPISNVQVTLTDGAAHSVDSSDIAFRHAAIGGFRLAYQKANPIILEPIMKVVVEAPTEFQGAVMATLNQRRGIIIGTTEETSSSIIEAEIPLAEMFGYSTILRSSTQGKAEFTMEFCRYKQVPQNIAEELKKEYNKKNPSQKAA